MKPEPHPIRRRRLALSLAVVPAGAWADDHKSKDHEAARTAPPGDRSAAADPDPGHRRAARPG